MNGQTDERKSDMINFFQEYLTSLKTGYVSKYDLYVNEEIEKLYLFNSTDNIDLRKITTIKLLLLNNLYVTEIIYNDLKKNLFNCDRLFNYSDDFTKIIDMDISTELNNKKYNLDNKKYHPEKRNELLKYSIIPDIYTKLKYKKYFNYISDLFKELNEKIETKKQKLDNLLKTDNFKNIFEIIIRDYIKRDKNQIDIHIDIHKKEVNETFQKIKFGKSDNNHQNKISELQSNINKLNLNIVKENVQIDVSSITIEKSVNDNEKILLEFYCNLFNRLKSSYNTILLKYNKITESKISAELYSKYTKKQFEIDTKLFKLERKHKFYENIQKFNIKLNL